jgi:hypothetical protein
MSAERERNPIVMQDRRPTFAFLGLMRLRLEVWSFFDAFLVRASSFSHCHTNSSSAWAFSGGVFSHD